MDFYQKQWDAFCQRNDAILKKLTALDPALRDELNKLLYEQLTLDQMRPAEMFAEGFTMAVKLMVETLTSA